MLTRLQNLVCVRVRVHMCADLLNLLYTRYNSSAGNGPGRSLLQHLLTAAAAPYCSGLEQWLRQGVLDDPYHEFMVQEDAVRGSPDSPQQPHARCRYITS